MKKLLTTILLLFTVANAMGKSQYVIHNSGLLLGINSESRAVLLNAANAKPLRMVEQTDGSYLFALDGTSSGTLYLSLGSSNNWSTYFLADSTSARAHYTIVQDGKYVKLKNMQTGSYLGTDDNTAGSYCYSDKSGSDTKHRWRLSDTPVIETTVDTLAYPISVDARRQLCEGWGVSLCWWANMCGKWSDKKIDELLKYMVSPTGLNWNIFRYNIGGGDDPNNTNCTLHHMGNGKGLRAEMEGFQDERGGEFHWDRDAAQRKIMLRIKELRPDAVFEAFSNSAPWWMTVSGCCSGNTDAGKDNLKTDYYEDFANYLVEVCKHYKEEYGIEFKTLEPFNEANTGFWHSNGVQEGCHFDPQSQIDFIRVLAPILEKSGLKTVISASDETSIGGSVYELQQCIAASDVMRQLGQWNTHSYSGNNRDRSQCGSLARANGKMLWMSESGSGGSGIAGNLSMAQRLIDDVRYIAPDAWIDWQYMEEANDQWCMVRGSFSDATFSRVKNYYVRAQVSRFIKAGYTFVTSLNEQSLAAINPTADTLAVVLLNRDDQQQHIISLPMAHVNGTIRAWRTSESESLKTLANACKLEGDSIIHISLPAASITTLLVPITTDVEYSAELVPGDTYMIVPQSNALMAAADNTTSLIIQPADPTNPAQLWTLEEASQATSTKPAYYRLKSGKGRYATYTTSAYAMKSSVTKSSTQIFDIQLVDGLYSKILQKGSTRGWDLNGGSLSEGTSIGVYNYGSSVAADTRNWQLVRVASEQTPTGIIDSPYTPSALQQQSTVPTAIYDLNGRQMRSMKPGINIVRMADGTYKKIFMKGNGL